MSKSSDIRLLDVSTATEKFAYRSPIKFGGRVVEHVVLFHLTLDVETRDGRRARGYGSMPVGNIWAWPSQRVSAEDSETAMIALSERLAQVARRCRSYGHPLELTHELAHDYAPQAAETVKALGLAEPMPRLAQLVSASPLESAIHDAYGRALGQNSYNVLSAAYVNRDLSTYLNDDFRGEYLDRYTLRAPKARMPLYHLVGALDPITEEDVTERLTDGLPMTLPEWTRYNGLTHFKIKLNGDNLAWDVDRVVKIETALAPTQAELGCQQWHYSLDFNEKCANVDYLLDFIGQVQQRSPQAFERVQYIEQPTHRDLKAHPENKMHAVARIKPVVIDESLVDFESLLLCRELGYSGVALKACKGQTEALLMGAAAQKYGMFLCVQDLSCPGWSFLHSASLSARIPTIAAIESNSRQYCPAANDGWRDRYPSMFEVRDGSLGTSALDGVGLGFEWVSTKS